MFPDDRPLGALLDEVECNLTEARRRLAVAMLEADNARATIEFEEQRRAALRTFMQHPSVVEQDIEPANPEFAEWRGLPRTDAILRVLRAEKQRSFTTREIIDELVRHGREDNYGSTSAALSYLSQSDRIDRAGRGKYKARVALSDAIMEMGKVFASGRAAADAIINQHGGEQIRALVQERNGLAHTEASP